MPHTMNYTMITCFVLLGLLYYMLIIVVNSDWWQLSIRICYDQHIVYLIRWLYKL